MQKKIRFWFTLVELLMVIVIIGILSMAILPKITGFLVKTRDLKRHADLRNIETAIQLYKNQKWFFPFLQTIPGNDPRGYLKAASALKSELIHYIPDIPKSPQANDRSKICIPAHKHMCKHSSLKSEYLYILKLQWEPWPLEKMKPIVILITKVESPDAANYVFIPQKQQNFTERGYPSNYFQNLWNAFRTYNSHNSTTYPARTGPKFDLCSEIEKWNEVKWTLKADWAYHCSYTDIDQLYYIVVIE